MIYRFTQKDSKTALFGVKKRLNGKLRSKVHRISHHELFGLRSVKYEWLEANDFNPALYEEIKPSAPFYLFHPEETGKEHYLEWKGLPEIFPLNSVGIVTARDKLTIQDTANQVRQTIHHFASLDIETARSAFQLGKDARDWKVEFAQNDLKDSGLRDDSIKPILYRPFDTRYTYYTGKSRGFLCMPRNEVMKQMLEENIGLVIGRQGLAVGDNQLWNLVFISRSITDFNLFYRGGGLLIPLYLYPDEHKEDIFASNERTYNIAPELLDKFRKLWPQFQPEQLFYYVYAILHSNSYRQRYAQYLRMDFPRVPFTENYELFSQLADYGKELADIHLLKSPRLDPPLARYQGSGADDRVDFIKYEPSSGIVQINEDKYFEGITPELWNFHIGGYQVLHKYLKDRKGKLLADPIHYCRMVTALAKTMELQKQVDLVFSQVDARAQDMDSL